MDIHNSEKLLTQFILNHPHFHGLIPDDFSPKTSLVAIGVVDSVGVLELISFIEEKFSVTIEPRHLIAGHFKDIQSLVLLLESMKSEEN